MQGGEARGGSGRRDGREQRAESEVESSSSSRVLFWKMVYGNFFRKPFSFFSFVFLRSNTNVFQLTFILRRNKRLQMLKTFYGKRFQPKQTEPKRNLHHLGSIVCCFLLDPSITSQQICCLEIFYGMTPISTSCKYSGMINKNPRTKKCLKKYVLLKIYIN